MECVVPPLTDPGEVGIRPENFRDILYCVSAGDTYLRVGYFGGDPPHGADPGGFHHRVVQQITGNLPKRQLYGGCQYHLILEILRELGMEEM